MSCSFATLQKEFLDLSQQKAKVEKMEVSQEPGEFDVKTALETDVDLVIIIIHTRKWQVSVVDSVAPCTSSF